MNYLPLQFELTHALNERFGVSRENCQIQFCSDSNDIRFHCKDKAFVRSLLDDPETEVKIARIGLAMDARFIKFIVSGAKQVACLSCKLTVEMYEGDHRKD